MEKDFIEFNGVKIYFCIQRKNIKNLYLKINKDKDIIVSIPKKMSLDRVKKFITEKATWIKKQEKIFDDYFIKKEKINFENDDIAYLLGKEYRIKIIKSNKNNVVINNKYIEIYVKEKYFQNKKYIKNVYEKWLKNYAENVLQNLVIKYQKLLSIYDIAIPQIEIRKMKSRWGSCIPNNNKVIFNLNLIKSPLYCIEYVVLHEMSHFKYQNHSKYFHKFVAKFMPDWKARKTILDRKYTGIF